MCDDCIHHITHLYIPIHSRITEIKCNTVIHTICDEWEVGKKRKRITSFEDIIRYDEIFSNWPVMTIVLKINCSFFTCSILNAALKLGDVCEYDDSCKYLDGFSSCHKEERKCRCQENYYPKLGISSLSSATDLTSSNINTDNTNSKIPTCVLGESIQSLSPPLSSNDFQSPWCNHTWTSTSLRKTVTKESVHTII